MKHHPHDLHWRNLGAALAMLGKDLDWLAKESGVDREALHLFIETGQCTLSEQEVQAILTVLAGGGLHLVHQRIEGRIHWSVELNRYFLDGDDTQLQMTDEQAS